MTILFFLKPYQFFDRGGVYKKHKEESYKDPIIGELSAPQIKEPSPEELQKIQLAKEKAEYERFKKQEKAAFEKKRLEIEQKAIDEALKAAEIAEAQREAEEKARKAYEEYLEQERLAAIERERIREEKRVARQKKHAILREKIRKGRAEKERIRIEMEESDIRELIFVINQHLEDNPY